MNNKYFDFTFHTAATQAANGKEFYVYDFKDLTVEIYGSEDNTARTVTFYCKGPSGTLRALKGLKVSDWTSDTSTTGTGEIWQFDITGVNSVVMDLTAITGGSVTVKGRAVT
jgi:hypothetical protein